MADGTELIIIGILTKVLKTEWDLPDFYVEIMGGVMFAGMIIGAIISGYLGDLIGRKASLQYFSILLLVGAIGSVLMPEIWSFVAVRAILGIGLGAIVPICSTLQLEVNT